MKKIIMCLWGLVCSGCALTPATQQEHPQVENENCPTPQWFKQSQPEPGVIVGLGVGITENEAITSAQASIARQLNSTVNSQCVDYEKIELINQQYSATQQQSCEHQSTTQRTLKRTTVTHTGTCGGVFRVRATWNANSLYSRLQDFFKQVPQGQQMTVPYRVLSDELISSSTVFTEAAKANHIQLVSTTAMAAAITTQGLTAQQKPSAELKTVWHEDGWQLILGREVLTLTHDEFWTSIDWHLATGNNAHFGLEPSKGKLSGHAENAYRLSLEGEPGEHVTLFNIYGNGNIQILGSRQQTIASIKTTIETQGEGALLAVWTKAVIDNNTFPKIPKNQDRELKQLKALTHILSREDVTSLRSHHYQKRSIQ